MLKTLSQNKKSHGHMGYLLQEPIAFVAYLMFLLFLQKMT